MTPTAPANNGIKKTLCKWLEGMKSRNPMSVLDLPLHIAGIGNCLANQDRKMLN
jgi:hypothetical protein